MSEPSTAISPDLATWKVELLRMTAILSPGSQISDQNWWENIVGKPPERRSSQPRIGILQDEGSFAGGKLVLAIHPFRVDWLLTVEIDPAHPSFEFPSIGVFSESLSSFSDLMSQWIKISPNLQRLAFGATLFLPCKDIHDTYKRLPNCFPLHKLDLTKAEDFGYQINRSRDSTLSGISGLSINRLSKWSVANLIVLPITNLENLKYSNKLTNEFAIRLEIDINTAQNFGGDLPNEKLLELFQELTELGKEIVLFGDIL